MSVLLFRVVGGWGRVAGCKLAAVRGWDRESGRCEALRACDERVGVGQSSAALGWMSKRGLRSQGGNSWGGATKSEMRSTKDDWAGWRASGSWETGKCPADTPRRRGPGPAPWQSVCPFPEIGSRCGRGLEELGASRASQRGSFLRIACFCGPGTRHPIFGQSRSRPSASCRFLAALRPDMLAFTKR